LNPIFYGVILKAETAGFEFESDYIWIFAVFLDERAIDYGNGS
jgi:hypothetical protein